MKAFLFLFVVIILSNDLEAQTNKAFGHLPLGNSPIGFKIITIDDDTRLTSPDKNILGEKITSDRTRKITLHIWYPAQAGANAALMKFGDYALSYQQEEVNQPIDSAARIRRFNTLRDQLKNFFGSFDEKDLETCLAAPLLARKNASPAQGKFPLLVGMLRSFSTTLTNELLASHGFIVIMVKPAPLPVAEWSVRYIDEVQDLRRATIYAIQSLNADADAIGSFGFSGAGFTQVLFSMNDYRPKALADLESGLYMEGLWQSWSTCNYYNVYNLRVPFLHIFSRDLARQEKYIAEFDKTKFSRRYQLLLNQPGLHHWDFATEGMISCTMLNMRGPQQRNIQSSFELANIYLLNFFQKELKNDKTASAFMENKPRLNNYHDSLWSMTILPALNPAPRAAEFTNLVTEKGIEQAIQILESRLPNDSSTNLLDGSLMNRIGYNYLASQQKKEAIAVFRLNTKLHPQEPNWQDSLLEALVADGRKDEAMVVYRSLNESIDKSNLPTEKKGGYEEARKYNDRKTLTSPVISKSMAMKKIFVIFISMIPIVSCAQDEQKQLDQIEKQLTSGSKSVSEVLIDPSYMKLHSLTSFRTLIRKHAKQEKISLANKSEPGTVATIKGKLTASYPVDNLLIYVYQTDNRGWYADTGAHVLVREGDRGHARLFGYLRSGKDGKFEFTTIHPQGYPRSDLPQHIHLEIFDQNGRSLIITELLFDDDARLVGETRSSAVRNGFVVAKNEGKEGMQLYSYTVSLQ